MNERRCPVCNLLIPYDSESAFGDHLDCKEKYWAQRERVKIKHAFDHARIMKRCIELKEEAHQEKMRNAFEAFNGHAEPMKGGDTA